MSLCVRCGQPLDPQAVQTPMGWMHGYCAQQAQAPVAMAPAMPPYGYGQPAFLDADVLPQWWLWLLYGTIPLCFVHGIVATVARVLYWTWRSSYPNKASTLRKHQLISSLITLVLWGGVWLILSSLGGD